MAPHSDRTNPGLYQPGMHKDNCGVGFVVDMQGRATHRIVEQGLEILHNLTHRGAVGADAYTGDGAGILLQKPHAFLQKAAKAAGIELPADSADYGAGLVFLPTDDAGARECMATVERIAAEEGQRVLGWREVEVHPEEIGDIAREMLPTIRQVFIGRGEDTSRERFELKLLVARKRVEHVIADEHPEYANHFYIPSLSSRTLIYKGLLLAEQVPAFYPDLSDPDMVSALALVHQRFSTNTHPTWPLAQPFRTIAHNGEINTVQGNHYMLRAREAAMESEAFGDDLEKLFPTIEDGLSDSASLDAAIELLSAAGRSLPHVMMMLIPEAWSTDPFMPEDLKAFYEYHATLMEPWDGPAAVAFTDGTRIGATLDRNGLRPARYVVTDDDLVVMASEVGVLPIPEEKIVLKERLHPGKIFMVDTERGRIIPDLELKQETLAQAPYKEWVAENLLRLDEMPEPKGRPREGHRPLREMQRAFGYTFEELNMLLKPMATTGAESVGSMGDDTPIAVLSERPRLLFDYFKQLFAQVTNPAIDPIREEQVMSLVSYLGPEGNLLEQTPGQARRVELKQPVLAQADLDKLRFCDDSACRTELLEATFPAAEGPEGLQTGLDRLCAAAEEAVRGGATVLVLSDWTVDEERAPIPSLLATGAVHHHLIRAGLRTKTSLVVETGEAREVAHFALLIGYGAGAVHPYLAFETLDDMLERGMLEEQADRDTVRHHYIKAVGKGLFKVFSKMGISTLQSYCGAQIFEAIGLSRELVDRYFRGTVTQIEGAGVPEIGADALERHAFAYHTPHTSELTLEDGGQYHWRVDGERHSWNPTTITLLQRACATQDFDLYGKFSEAVNENRREGGALRGLFQLANEVEGHPVEGPEAESNEWYGATPESADHLGPKAIPLEEVESVESIMRRFTTGAMSFGSISREAHETLAIAMNRIGGRSNSGEGGEDPVRFKPYPNGDLARSAIKQIASGRFGVTTHYAVNADELQIKVAQGAKPGEGGQLPGHKVDENIARVRYATPGVSLISPPPHHDIYSIEDLAQLIFDLKNVNPAANVSVKLVAKAGVGTVAAGVAKAKADVITVSGNAGGTGASPNTSIKHAGMPWELGVAETQQALVANGLRDRVRLQTDGNMLNGRDVVIAALLGADEYAFGTTALVVEGCIMMRKCHLNTCPVGVATQDPHLRKKFTGKPEDVITYFRMVAEEVRQYMAELGFRSMDELIGHTEMLVPRDLSDHPKASGLDLRPLLKRMDGGAEALHQVSRQKHDIDDILDRELIERAKPALDNATPVEFESEIRNYNRTTATMLAGEVAKRFGLEGLPEDTIQITFRGTAGQSFGAFCHNGMSLTLVGDANDYVGKAMSGGRIVVRMPEESRLDPEGNILAGNVLLYGATGGEAFVQGVVGERFGVRNSGAHAVAEGCGDHGCEYMTGGAVAILGKTGRNFAAGMSGGVAYVLDEDDTFEQRLNTGMVETEPVDHDDADLLMEMIERHVRYTGSAKGQRILDQWHSYRPKFVKIIPTEYRRVMEARKREARTETA
ncbi:glutamate synthase [Thiohalorhabdus denitrificans]|uniref:Glutamate synthase [NADPH] large chain n=1 Tax=Thiohalorhabdus denitrificans TaxID=381306 RepID=A0A0N8PND0_9GAMM|nr:glutamate synthase-related protein [Thiohalorhabdus denitrificans]KPV41181.1 glutamate synthase [Thiohalorhabdus denitrificans]SCY35495.1 glutamate synthase (NADH) large subunit [Thiohalorhabdus denitrificans]